MNLLDEYNQAQPNISYQRQHHVPYQVVSECLTASRFSEATKNENNIKV